MASSVNDEGCKCCLRISGLSRITNLALVLPHSSAQEGVSFNSKEKKQAFFSTQFGPKGNLSSILTIKLASTTEPADFFEPSKEVLRMAKSASWDCNKHIKKKQQQTSNNSILTL